MTTTTIKKKIHQYIDNADEKILNAVYTILEEHAKLKGEQEHELTATDIKELDKRWDNYKKGKTQTHTIKDSSKDIRSKLKNLK